MLELLLKTMDTEILFETSLLPACPSGHPLKYLPPHRATGIAFFPEQMC